MSSKLSMLLIVVVLCAVSGYVGGYFYDHHKAKPKSAPIGIMTENGPVWCESIQQRADDLYCNRKKETK